MNFVYDGTIFWLYSYKPDGMRLSKTVNGVKTTHIWDGSNIVMELNASNAVIDIYIRGVNLIKNNSGYYIFNAHGDVVSLANASGTVTKNYHYDAFGNETNKDANDKNPFRYCGEYIDLETNNYYLRARNYNPTTGRFLSEDTVTGVMRKLPNGMEVPDPLSLNRYTYCHNNPILYVDSSGHIAWFAVIAIGIVVLKVVDYGWTAWDIADSTRTLANPKSSGFDKILAGANIGLALGFEALEPDDFLPVSLPLDDAARKATMKTIKNILDTQGPVAVKNFVRKTFGSSADNLIKYADEAIAGMVSGTGKWAKGSYDSIADSLVDHFYRHGKDLGSKDVAQYLRQAEAFASSLKGATKYASDGFSHATTYIKSGKFIILDDFTKEILSFGLR